MSGSDNCNSPHLPQALLSANFHFRQYYRSFNSVPFCPNGAIRHREATISSCGLRQKSESPPPYCVGTMKLTTCKDKGHFLRNKSTNSSNLDLELAPHCAGLGLRRCGGGEVLSKKDLATLGGRKRGQTDAGWRSTSLPTGPRLVLWSRFPLHRGSLWFRDPTCWQDVVAQKRLRALQNEPNPRPQVIGFASSPRYPIGV